MITRPIILSCDYSVCSRSLNIPNPFRDSGDAVARAVARTKGWSEEDGQDLCDRCTHGLRLARARRD